MINFYAAEWSNPQPPTQYTNLSTLGFWAFETKIGRYKEDLTLLTSQLIYSLRASISWYENLQLTATTAEHRLALAQDQYRYNAVKQWIADLDGDRNLQDMFEGTAGIYVNNECTDEHITFRCLFKMILGRTRRPTISPPIASEAEAFSKKMSAMHDKLFGKFNEYYMMARQLNNFDCLYLPTFRSLYQFATGIRSGGLFGYFDVKVQTFKDEIHRIVNCLNAQPNGRTKLLSAYNMLNGYDMDIAENAAEFYAAHTACSISRLVLDEISGNFIDATERNSDLIITGTTSNVEDGQVVTAYLSSIPYTGSVLNNVFSIVVPSADLQALSPDLTYIVTASVENLAGQVFNDTEDVTMVPEATKADAPNNVVPVETENPGGFSFLVLGFNNDMDLAIQQMSTIISTTDKFLDSLSWGIRIISTTNIVLTADTADNNMLQDNAMHGVGLSDPNAIPNLAGEERARMLSEIRISGVATQISVTMKPKINQDYSNFEYIMSKAVKISMTSVGLRDRLHNMNDLMAIYPQ